MISSLSHSLLGIQIILITFIISSIPLKYKSMLVNSRPFIHINTGLLLMVIYSFLDSLIRLRTINEYLYYYIERNCILNGISLFLLIILKRIILLFKEIDNEKKNALCLQKQIINQKKFVDNLMKENENFELEIKNKNKIIESLKNEIKRNEVLIKQVKNNQDEYFRLLDKYNSLRFKDENKNK